MNSIKRERLPRASSQVCVDTRDRLTGQQLKSSPRYLDIKVTERCLYRQPKQYRVKTTRGQSPVVFFKVGTFGFFCPS